MVIWLAQLVDKNPQWSTTKKEIPFPMHPSTTTCWLPENTTLGLCTGFHKIVTKINFSSGAIPREALFRVKYTEEKVDQQSTYDLTGDKSSSETIHHPWIEMEIAMVSLATNMKTHIRYTLSI